MRHEKPKIGDVVQITLPSGKYAYGRVLRDASVAFYRTITEQPGEPPVGSREYQFVVAVYDDVLESDKAPVVGHDPSQSAEDEWPPPYCVRDPITRRLKLYHKGDMRAATEEECLGVEPAAVWDLHHLIDRLAGMAPVN